MILICHLRLFSQLLCFAHLLQLNDVPILHFEILKNAHEKHFQKLFVSLCHSLHYPGTCNFERDGTDQACDEHVCL